MWSNFNMSYGEYENYAQAWGDPYGHLRNSIAESKKAKEQRQKEEKLSDKFSEKVSDLIGSEREYAVWKTGQWFVNKNLINRLREEYKMGTDDSKRLAIAAAAEASLMSPRSKIFEKEILYLLQEKNADDLPYDEMPSACKASKKHLEEIAELGDPRIAAYSSQTPDAYIPIQFLSKDLEEIKEQVEYLCDYKEGKLMIPRMFLHFILYASDELRKPYHSVIFDLVHERSGKDLEHTKLIMKSLVGPLKEDFAKFRERIDPYIEQYLFKRVKAEDVLL